MSDLREEFISYPIPFLPNMRATFTVVPVPRKGSKTISPMQENIRIRRYGSSSGNGAVSAWFCLSPRRSQVCENHTSLSAFEYWLAYLNGSWGVMTRLGPLRKTRMYSQSRVTYALGGKKPDPRNAFGLFVGLRHRTGTSD